MPKLTPKQANPILPFVREIRETRALDELVTLLNTGAWVVICAAHDAARADSYLFSLGRVI